MTNQYPLWKNILLALVVLVAGFYALPNLYGEDPSLQISAKRAAKVDESTQQTVEFTLRNANLPFQSVEKIEHGLLIRFTNTETQLKAQDALKNVLKSADYTVALNLAPATPHWLRAINAKPMFLGLDLRGGVHFLMEVDMEAALQQAEERYVSDLRAAMRSAKVRYTFVGRNTGAAGVVIKFKSAAERQEAVTLLDKDFRNLIRAESESQNEFVIKLTLSEQDRLEVQRFALQQNVTTLRNRVNELGVAEPLIQQQGTNRIVVQLPGVQDTARAKEILGATATLEFRLVDESGNAQEATKGTPPLGSRLYHERNGTPILLKKSVIVTGDQIIDASSGLDQTGGSAAVFISLDGQGAKSMHTTTKENVGRLMAVVFIENKVETSTVDGKSVRKTQKVEEVINVARIREPFSKRFQISGLDSPDEARNLALLLRAGSLSVPIYIVEERTVGPSLGQENIEKGFFACIVGFIAIGLFMSVYYRAFGVIATVSLFTNMVLLVALLSMLQLTLTLPGIAGIALTLGMAIDANVLIFERVREELRAGNTPRASIHAGYERAWDTIFDSNITTLIAGLALFLLGSGPVRGFAVVLCLGILTSMFSAVLISRAMVNLTYGQRKVSKLAI
ncbi:MAG: preprotein translocase subunit SecD [Halothiobacillaceae bacterium]|nr:MAG: preprotein translocase subunit SecD [Halothiobacillaceae bacterium]